MEADEGVGRGRHSRRKLTRAYDSARGADVGESKILTKELLFDIKKNFLQQGRAC
jgi:hypothetical protein